MYHAHTCARTFCSTEILWVNRGIQDAISKSVTVPDKDKTTTIYITFIHTPSDLC